MILSLLDFIVNFALYYDWLREHQPRFHKAQYQVFMPRFHFKVANIMTKTQQCKMALLFLIVGVFVSLNM